MPPAIKHLLSLTIVLAMQQQARSETLNEPWQEEVIAGAQTFVLGEVVSIDARRNTATVRILKNIEGLNLPDRIVIGGFWEFAESDESNTPGWTLPFHRGDTCYFMLKSDASQDRWALPTPTAGFALVERGFVNATYTHRSYDISIPMGLYEWSMQQIYLGMHGMAYDLDGMTAFINTTLSLGPADGRTDPRHPASSLFFRQQVALESAAHLRLAESLEQLEPFLGSDNAQTQIAAVRALSRSDLPGASTQLLEFLTRDRDGIARVLAVWGLEDRNARELVQQLAAFVERAPTTQLHFDAAAVGYPTATWFPSSVREAVEQLLESWSGS